MTYKSNVTANFTRRSSVEVYLRSRQSPTRPLLDCILHQSQVPVPADTVQQSFCLLFPSILCDEFFSHQEHAHLLLFFLRFRYDGIQLWDLRLEPGMHDFVWWSSLVSFLFLYPSTFNLLEVIMMCQIAFVNRLHDFAHYLN